jgi:hypothetical protein
MCDGEDNLQGFALGQSFVAEKRDSAAAEINGLDRSSALPGAGQGIDVAGKGDGDPKGLSEFFSKGPQKFHVNDLTMGTGDMDQIGTVMVRHIDELKLMQRLHSRDLAAEHLNVPIGMVRGVQQDPVGHRPGMAVQNEKFIVVFGRLHPFSSSLS